MQMKKLLAILMLFSMFGLCACTQEDFPFANRQMAGVAPKVFCVYVCGAVQTEGYVEVQEGADIRQLVLLAGYIPQTEMPSLPYALVTNTSALVLRYFDGSKFCYCTNLNGAAAQNCLAENVPLEVQQKIAAHLKQQGKISDRTQLKQILTQQEYDDNFYKYFVSEEDYEKID